jgi:peptide/nickel transport system substrate-binding protein
MRMLLPKAPKAVIAAFVATCTISLAACTVVPATDAPAAQPAAPGSAPETIIFGLYQEPEILNPYLRTQNAAGEVGSLIDEGLINVDQDGNYFPELATSVPSVENGLVSEDGLIVTYPLRDDVKWSDGEPFTCDDVLFTWEVLNSPDSGALATAGYDQVASVTCPDDYTAVVTYSNLYAPFLSHFYAILPRHASGALADMVNWPTNWAPIGTGPYKLQEWIRGDRLVLVKNENFRGAPDLPKTDQIVIRIIPSREVGKVLITTGEIDVLWDLTEADVPEFATNPDVIVHNVPGPSAERLVLNLADPTLDATPDPANHPHPILGDVRVRQAIQLGIDKQLLVDELLFGATTVSSAELATGWAACDIPPSVYDPEQAAALLEETGWVDGDGDGIRECAGCEHAEAGTPLHLKLQSTTGNQLREETEQLIVEMMRAIGIDMAIENLPSPEFFGTWSSGAIRPHGHFDVLMYSTNDGVDPHSIMVNYYGSEGIPTEANDGAGRNFSRWIDTAADEALAAAGATTDLAARKAAYQIVCEQVAADVPQIYLYERAEIHLARANITGFVVNPWNAVTWNAELWEKQ